MKIKQIIKDYSYILIEAVSTLSELGVSIKSNWTDDSLYHILKNLIKEYGYRLKEIDFKEFVLKVFSFTQKDDSERFLSYFSDFENATLLDYFVFLIENCTQDLSEVKFSEVVKYYRDYKNLKELKKNDVEIIKGNFGIVYLYVKNYKILSDFSLEFKNNVSIFIGENGSGKSTVLELLSIVFAYLYNYVYFRRSFRYLNEQIDSICFKLVYILNDKSIQISHTPEYKKSIDFFVNGITMPLEKLGDYLPENIVISYSGVTNRLNNIVSFFDDKFVYSTIRERHFYSNEYSLRPFRLPQNRIFYSHPDYLPFIVFSLLFSQKKEARSFISNIITADIDEADLKVVIKDRNKLWRVRSMANQILTQDNVVTQFLSLLNNNSRSKFIFDSKVGNKVDNRFKNRTFNNRESFDFDFNLKLMVSMISDLKQNISPKEVFDLFYFLYHIELLKTISFSWGKHNEFSLENLSEGQKQEILTIGFSLIFDNPSTLFLLDEPDTFLHPKWQREFISSLMKATANGSCAIVTTHSPLMVSGVKKEQLFVLRDGNVVEKSLNTFGKPAEDLLIDYYDLDSTRNKEAQDAIDELYNMIHNDEYESEDFKNAFEQLESKIGSDDKVFSNLKLAIIRRKKICSR